ncbi:MAG: hypothetical protein BAJALOKI3v1_430018 [Promethearchaeota archaeon]|nr:MAG: hypothetical protein BAJALOKI3v1_430018 [Candidatus Lokiarchaeota archaeon]
MNGAIIFEFIINRKERKEERVNSLLLQGDSIIRTVRNAYTAPEAEIRFKF